MLLVLREHQLDSSSHNLFQTLNPIGVYTSSSLWESSFVYVHACVPHSHRHTDTYTSGVWLCVETSLVATTVGESRHRHLLRKTGKHPPLQRTDLTTEIAEMPVLQIEKLWPWVTKSRITAQVWTSVILLISLGLSLWVLQLPRNCMFQHYQINARFKRVIRYSGSEVLGSGLLQSWAHDRALGRSLLSQNDPT